MPYAPDLEMQPEDGKTGNEKKHGKWNPGKGEKEDMA
jgi:hypothetical protein